MSNQINHCANNCYTFGNFYVIAPENAIGYPTLINETFTQNVANFESVFQYGSNFIDDPQGKPYEKSCYRDGVVPQVVINAKQNLSNVFIPITDEYKWMREFNKTHYIANYDWIFTEPSKPQAAKVKKRTLKNEK